MAIPARPALLGTEPPASGSIARRLQPRTLAAAAAVLSLLSSAACLVTLDIFLPGRSSLSAALMQWDAGWWRAVALHGYWNPANALNGRHVVYFPLLPLLERFGRDVTGSLELFVVGVNIAAQAVAAVLLFYIARHNGAKDGEALGWVALFVVSPPVVFDVMGYDIALLTLFLVAALFLAQRHHPWWAAVALGLSSATNPIGIAFAAGFAVWSMIELVRAPALSGRSLPSFVGQIGVSFSGILAYMLYLQVRFDAPFSFYEAARFWAPDRPFGVMMGRILTFRPVRGSILRFVAEPYGAHTSQLIDAGATVVVMALVIGLFVSEGGVRTLGFWTLAAVLLLAQVESSRLGFEESTTRFVLPAAFGAGAVASVCRLLTRPVALAIAAVVLAAGTVFFLHNLATGQWVD